MRLTETGDSEKQTSPPGDEVQRPAEQGAAERAPAPRAAPTYSVAEELTPREVNDFFNALDKAVRARRLYAANNPAYKAFLAALRNSVIALWSGGNALSVIVDENGFRWHEEMFSPGEGREHLAFQFYKDGIRALTFLPGFELEIERFLDVLARARQIDSTSADDMVTLLWEQEFTSLLYNYVDALVEGLEIPDSGPIPIPFEKLDLTLVSAEITGSDQSVSVPPAVQAGQPPVAQAISSDDFKETLYFLEAGELEYLRVEVEKELQRDVKADVLSALFDRLEDPMPARQTEILRNIRQLLPAYLSSGDLRSASTILIELNNVLEAREVLGPTQTREAQEIFAELSDPAVLHQLLKSLEDGAIDPSGEELAIFLRYLRPDTLGPLVRAVETTKVPELQLRLRAAIEGLGRAHPQMVMELLDSSDTPTVVGAARLAGQIGLSQAVTGLSKLLTHAAASVRRASVEALVQIKSGTALDALQQALEDNEREVRIAAARGLGSLRYQPARTRLADMLQGRIVREADLTEKIAFFEAFGAVANADSVTMLDKLLNGKSLLRKQSPELRACAAMALGKVGTPASRAALERAGEDPNPMVRNAVQKAMRQETPMP
ncbi:MAG TPA: HEAT repeat domain-containing protein [Longimicrobiales bacterium]|nr:HEAT repeat domain-containing protein [Longimicrobiales bacterium]